MQMKLLVDFNIKEWPFLVKSHFSPYMVSIYIILALVIYFDSTEITTGLPLQRSTPPHTVTVLPSI